MEAGGACSRPPRPSSVPLESARARAAGMAAEAEGDMKGVALYAHVSTAMGQNPEMQLSELREYCRRR